jgi:hypothetical protein
VRIQFQTSISLSFRPAQAKSPKFGNGMTYYQCETDIEAFRWPPASRSVDTIAAIPAVTCSGKIDPPRAAPHLATSQNRISGMPTKLLCIVCNPRHARLDKGWVIVQDHLVFLRCRIWEPLRCFVHGLTIALNATSASCFQHARGSCLSLSLARACPYGH